MENNNFEILNEKLDMILEALSIDDADNITFSDINDKIVNVKQVASVLKLTKYRVYQIIKEGKLTPINKTGNFLFRMKDVMYFMRHGKSE